MKYTIEENGITAEKNPFFNPVDTVCCGQLFRYNINDNAVTVYSKDKRCVITENGDKYNIQTNDPKYFANYLDFDRNYDIIYNKLTDKGRIADCLEYSKGIRILNQDPIETIFSFIISANNNIPRIQKIIGKLCEALGDNMGGYYAFPTLEALSRQNEEFYKECGAGYRAAYIADTAKSLMQSDIESLRGLETCELLKKLLLLKGVGPKVADCIALFGFHKEDVFPVDTWIKKVYNCYFGHSDDPKLIRKELTEIFGNLSGYMQQYLFYYQREIDN